jgi:hypothetical protein
VLQQHARNPSGLVIEDLVVVRPSRPHSGALVLGGPRIAF